MSPTEENPATTQSNFLSFGKTRCLDDDSCCKMGNYSNDEAPSSVLSNVLRQRKQSSEDYSSCKVGKYSTKSGRPSSVPSNAVCHRKRHPRDDDSSCETSKDSDTEKLSSVRSNSARPRKQHSSGDNSPCEVNKNQRSNFETNEIISDNNEDDIPSQLCHAKTAKKKRPCPDINSSRKKGRKRIKSEVNGVESLVEETCAMSRKQECESPHMDALERFKGSLAARSPPSDVKQHVHEQQEGSQSSLTEENIRNSIKIQYEIAQSRLKASNENFSILTSPNLFEPPFQLPLPTQMAQLLGSGISNNIALNPNIDQLLEYARATNGVLPAMPRGISSPLVSDIQAHALLTANQFRLLRMPTVMNQPRFPTTAETLLESMGRKNTAYEGTSHQGNAHLYNLLERETCQQDFRRLLSQYSAQMNPLLIAHNQREASLVHNDQAAVESFTTQQLSPTVDTNQNQVPSPRRHDDTVPPSLPVLLSIPEDDTKLTSQRILLRQQIEVFKAGEGDVSIHTRGRNKAIKLGQVGIRCRHCAHLPVIQRLKGSTYFPSSLFGIYQVAQNMNNTHMQSGVCTEMPEEIKREFKQLISSRASTSFAGRVYWAEAAKKLGLVETSEGIRFIRDLR